MKRYVFFIALLALLLVSRAPVTAQGEHDFAKKVIADFVAATQAYIDSIKEVTSAKDYADRINAYYEALVPLKPKMMEMQKKYKLKETDPPPELKPDVEKLETVMGDMMGASMKMMQHAQDPAVMEASQKLQDLLRGDPDETPTDPPPPPAEAPEKPTPPPPPPPPPPKTVLVVTAGDSEKMDILVSYLQAGFIEGAPKEKDFIMLDEPPRQGTPRFHLALRANLVGTQQLEHYGSSTTMYNLSLTLKMIKVHSGAILAGPYTSVINYTRLNAEENLKEGIQELLQKVLDKLAN